MSPQPPSTAAKRVWSHNTNYTGVAGIHSEDGPIAHAQNTRMDRHSSTALTTEEEILRKKMKSLRVSRKSLETSMLSYSQKMKEIADGREQMSKSSPTSQKSQKSLTLTHSNNNDERVNCSRSKLTTLDNDQSPKVLARHMSLPFLTGPKEENIKTLLSEKQFNAVSTISDQRGRISADSGFGTESDSYLSDAESVTRPRLMSGTSSNSEDTISHQDSSPSHNRKIGGRKRGQTRSKRFRGSETTELATVYDTEGQHKDTLEERENGEVNNKDNDESVVISPFPENNNADALSFRLGSISEVEDYTFNESDFLNRTRILNPLTSSPTIRWKQSTSPRTQKKTPHVLTKPKAAYSPSIGSIRFRRLQRKQSKKNSKSNRHCFKYSDAVETALRSFNNSPEGRRDPPESPDLPGLDLNELLNEVIQRPYDWEILKADEPEEIVKPHRLFRERSFSEPIPVPKPMSFTSSLEQVREDDEAELRSVLKKNPGQYPAEKKSVQFFLPDIFLHANACTSRPAALR